MALKFLNKKGWHTGSLRNVENVWKAEQKHDAEQKKLDELRKQIQEERERSEFRQLQEQAGLVPRQERLDFLYDSGLAVGRSDGGGGGASGSGFQALDQASSTAAPSSAAAGSVKQQSSTPGALFEDKPHSASDAWRKLHSDPLLLIRQREQEALARVKNNPIKMAQIRKSVEAKKHKDKSRDKKDHKKKHKEHSYAEYAMPSEDDKLRKSHKSTYHEEEHHHNKRPASGNELSDRRDHRKNHYNDLKYREQSPSSLSESKCARSDARDSTKRNYDRPKHDKYSSEGRRSYDDDRRGRENKSSYYDDDRRGRENKSSYDDDDRRGREKKSYYESNRSDNSAPAIRSEANYRRRNVALAPKMSEEERAARLQEMQVNAEVHEEQRWKRLRKAEEDDAREAIRDGVVSGKNFLETAKKSVFGAEKGGSSSIEESVRRRTHYLQGRSESEGNAFRR